MCLYLDLFIYYLHYLLLFLEYTTIGWWVCVCVCWVAGVEYHSFVALRHMAFK